MIAYLFIVNGSLSPFHATLMHKETNESYICFLSYLESYQKIDGTLRCQFPPYRLNYPLSYLKYTELFSSLCDNFMC